MSAEIGHNYFEYRNELRDLYGKDCYIAYSQLELVKASNSEVDLDYSKVLGLALKQTFRFKFKQAINIYTSHRSIIKLLASRDSHNNSFISREVQKEYNLEDKLLDSQQIEAVVACEDANLVLAAAGSGKTLSLLAKVRYLHEQLGVPLSKILTISFTNNTTRELKERLSNIGLDADGVRTFHSLGNWILKESSGKTKRLFQDDAIKRFVSKTVTDLRENDETYARAYNDYLLYYHSTPIDPLELKDEKEAIDFNKSFLRRTLQSISMKKNEYDKTRPALAGEYVRSKEEQIIANFLFINQVSYEYEKQYPYMDTKYRPDFTIEEFEEPIYLE
ncbi:MAG: UvrD-helicase domain-containing protein, partial [bacterium]|nr:UvrD-helicase domain-containing protein [bacterium]